MDKKSPPNHTGHHPPHQKSSHSGHHGHHHSHNNNEAMEQVKISRVKRNKKKITSKEKVLAGLGLGASLIGGAGAVAPKPSQTQIVRSDDSQKTGASGKIKETIKNIFGVGKAKAAELTPEQQAALSILSSGLNPDGTPASQEDLAAANQIYYGQVYNNQSNVAGANAGVQNPADPDAGNNDEPPPANVGNDTQTPPATGVDLTGLTTVKDINESRTGTVNVNGVPTQLSVIGSDGRIFDNEGHEVTGNFSATELDAIRAAFNNDSNLANTGGGGTDGGGSGAGTGNDDQGAATTRIDTTGGRSVHQVYQNNQWVDAPEVGDTFIDSEGKTHRNVGSANGSPYWIVEGQETGDGTQEGEVRSTQEGGFLAYHNGDWTQPRPGDKFTDGSGLIYTFSQTLTAPGSWVLDDGQHTTDGQGIPLVSVGGVWQPVGQENNNQTPPGAAVIPAGLTVEDDINNSKKGTVSINGESTVINVTLDPYGSYHVYNDKGEEITSTIANVNDLGRAFFATDDNGGDETAHEGDVKSEGGLDYIYHNNQWVLKDGNVKIENGRHYHTEGGVWVEDQAEGEQPHEGESRSADGGIVVYHIDSNGNGQWTAPRSGDKFTDGSGFTYTFEKVLTEPGSWVMDNGQHTTNAAGEQLESQGGKWVVTGTVVLPSAVTIPTGLTLKDDVNNSKQGTVSIRGVNTVVNVTRDSDGNYHVYNEKGEEITSTITNLEELGNAFFRSGDGGGASGINLTGLRTTPDINRSRTGVIKINGVNTTLSMLSDGRIFDDRGQEITDTFSESDLAAIRAAFADDANLASVAREGDVRDDADGFHYTYHGTQWVLNDGQERTRNTFKERSLGGAWVLVDGQSATRDGFRYISRGGSFVLVDGQTKTENGKGYHTAGGVWVEDGAAGVSPEQAKINAAGASLSRGSLTPEAIQLGIKDMAEANSIYYTFYAQQQKSEMVTSGESPVDANGNVRTAAGWKQMGDGIYYNTKTGITSNRDGSIQSRTSDGFGNTRNQAFLNGFTATPLANLSQYGVPYTDKHGNPIGGKSSYNPDYYVDQDTATALAKALGLEAVLVSPGGGMFNMPPEWGIRLPNGDIMSAGLTAHMYLNNPVSADEIVRQMVKAAGGTFTGADFGSGRLNNVSSTGAGSTGSGTTAVLPTGQTFSFINVTTGNSSIFKVGDTWRMTVKGAPDTDVFVVTSKNGGASETVKIGRTDKVTGEFTVSKTIGVGDVGNWSETWKVGDVTVAQFSFTVTAAATALPNPAEVSFTFVNKTHPGASVFTVGDEFEITFTSTPNTKVYVTTNHNGFISSEERGITGVTDGKFVTRGVMKTEHIGDWSETWKVGDKIISSFTFKVQASPSAAAAAFTLSSSTVALVPGMSFNVSIQNAGTEQFTVTSSNPNAVKATLNGGSIVLTAGSFPGNAVITVHPNSAGTATDKDKTITVTVATPGTVVVSGTVSSLTLSKTTSSVAVGSTDTVIALVAMTTGANNGNVSVTSSDPAKVTASVNTATGVITLRGVTAGTATITVHPLNATDASKDKVIVVTVAGTVSTAPVVSQITPNSAARGEHGTFVITGQNLQNATLSFVNSTGLTLSNVQVNASGTQISASLSIANTATLGLNILRVTTATGSADTTFTVNAAAASTADKTSTGTGAKDDLVVTTTGGSTGTQGTGSGGTVTYTSSGGGGIVAGVTPFFTTINPPNAAVGQSYGAYIQAVSNYPMTFSIINGTLPPGLSMNDAGYISGTPMATGSFTFTVKAATNQGVISTKQFILVVGNAGSVSFSSQYGGAVAGVQTFQGLQMPSGYSASTGGLKMPAGYPASEGGSGLQMPEDVGRDTEKSGKSYTVKKGDTLWKIAKATTGDGRNWRKILAENPKSLSSPGNTKTLKVGAVLSIPQI